ncbi:FkbM family methyltransferase [Azospirillum thiophilum]|nr:FkbM family methyltransferase [Azospirillum thiophilum]
MTDIDRTGKINFHYIGGRAGAYGPFFLKSYADEMVFHIYDGDPDCLDQIASDPALRPFDFNVKPVIFARTNGPVAININYDPFTSSCLELNEEMAGGSSILPDGDYVMGEACRTVRRVEGLGQTLDQVASETGNPIDFLTMDTQGSELDILMGGVDVTKRQLIGFISEVEFEPIYRNQPLFGDIHAWARAQGFRLINLNMAPVDWSPVRLPVGWCGKGELLFGDALFLKTPARIVADHHDPVASLAKAVFIGLVLGQIGYVAECLALMPDDAAMPERLGPRYRMLAHDIAALYKKDRHLFVPSFADIYSEQRSFARFTPTTPINGMWDTDPAETRQRYFAHTDKALFLEAFPRLLSSALTPFEAALAAYEFKRAAALVREYRLKHADLLGRTLGLGTAVDGKALIDLETLRSELAHGLE